MKDDMLQRFLGLIEKTSDKVIVTDPAGEHPYVLMSLDHYERLLTGAPTAPASKPLEEKPVGIPVAAVSEPVPAVETVELRKRQPTAKPAVKKDFALWRAQIGREMLAEASIRELARPGAPKAKVTAPSLEELKLDAEGEEQFFLEPLE